VNPKASSDADSAWLSMVSYAWSGYVLPFMLPNECTVRMHMHVM